MKRRPPPALPEFVNLHGEALDPDTLLNRLRTLIPGKSGPSPTSTVARPPTQQEPGKHEAEADLDDSDLQQVLDAVCLAGTARSRTWLGHFLRGMDWRHHGGTRAFRNDELQAALQRLAERGQVLAERGIGWRASPAAWQKRWPALCQHSQAPHFWTTWVWANSGALGTLQSAPRYTDVRSPEEAQALLRLVLLARPDVEGYNRLLQGPLVGVVSGEALLRALGEPFNADLLASLQPRLLWALIGIIEGQVASGLSTQPALAQWVAQRMLQHASEVPVLVWLRTAERRLLANQAPAAAQALQALPPDEPTRGLLEALLQVHAGRWAEGSTAFTLHHKALAKLVGKRSRLLPTNLVRWQALALLAQPEASAWTEARKLALAEAGSRRPGPFHGWGLLAHAVAVRLGDEPLEKEALQPMPAHWRGAEADADEDDAMRLVLAAWMGHRPAGWPGPQLRALLARLHQQGQVWLADLAEQALVKLGLTVPPRPAGAAAAWPVAFFGAPAEAWREALAAIAALDNTASTSGERRLLHWQLTLDDAGRPHDLQCFERAANGRLKAVGLTALKRAERLDARDAAVVRCLRHASWDKRRLWLDLASATAALVGHPDLALADAPEQVLTLAEGRPIVEMRRERQADGSEAFRLHLDELALDGPTPPALTHHWGDARDDEEIARREAVRVVRDQPDQARLLRITAAQRRVAELAKKPWAVPASAQAELGAALRALAGHFSVHSDAEHPSRSLPAEHRLVAQMTPRGGTLQVRLVVKPFLALGADVGPALPPGSGRTRWLVKHGDEACSTVRDLAAEQAHLAALGEALPFLEDPQADDSVCGWTIQDPDLALAALETLGRHVAVATLEWPQGQPLRVISPNQNRLTAVVNSGGRDWLGVNASLAVDDGRVLSLRQLLALVQQADGSRFVPLGENAWLALTDKLRQQLADLAALAETVPATDASGATTARGRKKAGTTADDLQLPAAAAAWLADALTDEQGNAPQGDAHWQRRLQALADAAALQPQAPAGLQASLRPYQAEGLAWLVRRTAAGFGAVLADDMGLGKTLQTLALLLHRAAEGPALVVAPTSVVANWAAEALRFAPGLRVRDQTTERQAALADLAPGDLVLTSYGLLLRDAEAFAAVSWGTLVLDEAQALKNAATQRAKAVGELQAAARIALSGTPVENRLADLWSLMNLLNPGLLGSAQRFAERFGNPIERQRDDAARQRLRRIVAPFILRRTKTQVLDDLPPRTEIVHRIEAGDDERALTEALRQQALDRVSRLAKSGGHAAVQVLAELTRLRRAACDPRLVVPELASAGLQHGGAKLQAIEALVQELVEGRHQALLFSQFTDFLDRIGERLQANGIPFQRLDGSTPAAQRAQRVAAFQRGEGAVFLISLKAGGFGLNLTAADYVIIADPWWNPAAEDQATGRAHRMGQQRPVTVYRLVLAGSVEERIVALHHEKRALADGLLEGQDSAGAVVDTEALMALLRGQ
jgi:superfamily II DNA or RNA helicase